MPPRTTRNTRAKGAAADSTAASAAPASSKYTLEAKAANPPRLFVLPKKVASSARIVTLPHPRYASKPARFLVCPETGVYEFTQIASPKSAPCSWLITGQEANKGPEEVREKTVEEGIEGAHDSSAASSFSSHITEDADLFVATAVDPLFLILPALFAQPTPSSPSDNDYRSSSVPRKRMFLTAEDHFDALPQDGGSHLAQLLRSQPTVQALFTKRIAAICDTVEAGDETMYRLNEDKLLLVLLAKAQRTGSHQVLPPSLETKFVTKALEAPVQSTRSLAGPAATATAALATSSASANGASTPLSTTDSVDSAESAATSLVSEASSLSTASTAATSVSCESASDVQAAFQAPDEVVALQRLRIAFQLICSRYVPPAIVAILQKKLKDNPESGGVDFAPLDAYLSKLEMLRRETLLARSAALDYIGHKRGLEDEDDDDRAEKRRKMQEEEKRKKAGQSRGVRDLKKVNVSGMKKMSDFFKKK